MIPKYRKQVKSVRSVGRILFFAEKRGSMTKEELLSLGVNDSVEHVDFMIGTPDLSVTGIKENGEEIPLFNDGDWVI